MNPDQVRRQWADRAGEFSPTYYAHYGPDERSEAVRETLDRFVDRDAAVLELGCSSGRHLAHLREHGYDDLTGIDLNDEAFDVMADAYPDLADAGTFHHGAIEDHVVDVADGRFDAVYSVETLQHVHPEAEWVFADLARITDDLLVTVENEDEAADRDDGAADPPVNYVHDDVPLYYRDWGRIFTEFGLEQVAVEVRERDTLRVFRDAEE